MTQTQAFKANSSRRIVQPLGDSCLNCLRDANLSAAEIDEVILVGGMTRMPRIQKLAEETFKVPNKGES